MGENRFTASATEATLEDLTASEDIKKFVAANKSGVGRLLAAVFQINTLDQAQKLATMLATQYPEPDRVAIGIWELLANSIEHGNLEIDYDTKTDLLNAGLFEAEIERRLAAPEFCQRVTNVEFKRSQRAVHLRVTDQGPGFDYKRFLRAEALTVRPNGRGILIAHKMCFDRLCYRGRGNIVQTAVRVQGA